MNKSRQEETYVPPKWADKFLSWYCSPELIDEIQGDLHEVFHKNVKQKGLSYAQMIFIKDTLLFFRPSSFERRTNITPAPKKQPKIYLAMLQYYLKIASRNFLKYKVFSLINVVGLTLGLTFTMLISLWVIDELSYNQSLPNKEHIYKVMSNLYWSGDTPATSNTTPGPLEDYIKETIPEVQRVSKMQNTEELFTINEETFKKRGMYVSSSFLDLFQFPVIHPLGSIPSIKLGEIILTETMAIELFGSTDILGEVVQLNQKENLTIVAILKDIPAQSTLQFDWLASFEVFAKDRDWVKTWGNFSFPTYVQLAPSTDQENLLAKLNAIPQIKEHRASLFLHPLEDVYLYSKFENGKVAGGRIEYIHLFGTIALLILLLACINFINLSTARASQRAREIGIRKVVGAQKGSLVNLFMVESLLTTLLSVSMALVITSLLLPTFNTLFDKELFLDYTAPMLWVGIIGLCLITSFISGSYPALFLSSLKPINVLKGKIYLGKNHSAWLRKSLVVFQFILSFVLISGVLAISQQIDFIKDKNLGLDRNNIIEIELTGIGSGDYTTKLETFRQELLASSSIQLMTTTGGNPIDVQGTSGDFNWPEKDAETNIAISPILVGDHFIETLGIELLNGRDFRSYPADSANYIINESAAKLMGLENPVGHEASFWLGSGQIIGVIEDYHLKSLHETITPQILVYEPGNTWMALIKATEGETEEAIAHIENTYKSISPGFPFSYQFIDEAFERQYRSETVTGKLANWFAGAAIFISCLGLLGLVIYTTERRTKEIGIRKVLGASVSQIFGLLSSSFLKLVAIAVLIASPIAWVVVKNWLDNFAYHIDLQIGLFIFAAILATGFAFLTLCVQSVKTALANPINSLREE